MPLALAPQVKGQRRELLTSYEEKVDGVGMDTNEVKRQEVLARAAAAPPVPVVRCATRALAL